MPSLPEHAAQPLRFVVNGLVATVVHYAVLHVCIEDVGLPSAGVSNLIAACFGISASFLGNRWYVFAATREPVWRQFARFSLLYAGLALMQGGLLALWTDFAGLDYRAGFLLGIGLQVLGSWYGGRHWVFRR